jgi:hypothetical protein
MLTFSIFCSDLSSFDTVRDLRLACVRQFDKPICPYLVRLLYNGSEFTLDHDEVSLGVQCKSHLPENEQIAKPDKGNENRPLAIMLGR